MSNHRVFAALYDHLTAGAERAGLAAKRRELLSPLRGTVVELGPGTGVNLPYYRELDQLYLIEPDAAMRRRLRARIEALGATFPIDILDHEVGRTPLPIPAATIDAAVATLVLCSARNVSSVLAALVEMLKPSAPFVVIEHVRGHGVSAALQSLLTPPQRLVAGGCHLNRDTRAALIAAGLNTDGVDAWQLPGGAPLLRSAIAGIARKS